MLSTVASRVLIQGIYQLCLRIPPSTPPKLPMLNTTKGAVHGPGARGNFGSPPACSFDSVVSGRAAGCPGCRAKQEGDPTRKCFILAARLRFTPPSGVQVYRTAR